MEPKSGFDFGVALILLNERKRVRRAGWNGKGMWLGLVKANDYTVVVPPCSDQDVPSPDHMLPWIGIKTANNEFVPWLASQTDMLALDWEVVE